LNLGLAAASFFVDNRFMPIALLTDFGTSDYFVAAMKGTMLKIAPDAGFIDITHEIPPQDIRSTAFVLRACYRDFPQGTVFLCVVDPGVGSERRAIVVEAEDYLFVGPDNGLFSFVLEMDGTHAYEIANRELLPNRVSTTFHGRDIFAPIAAYLSTGLPAAEVGPRIDDHVMFEFARPQRVSEAELRGEVIHIDHFGNLVTNFRPEQIIGNCVFEINGHTVQRRVDHFAEANRGEVIYVTGSAGFVEISSNLDSAARILNAAVGDSVVMKLGV
jgi:S-adenosylmethionine hydrolase